MRTEINKLSGNVLTVYLNTNPASDDWKIRLKNGLRRTTEYVNAANPEQLDEFVQVRRKVERAIQDVQRSLTNSLICLATKEQLLLYQLQIPVENDFTWKSEPNIEQLNLLFKTYARSGVILLQQEQVTLITSSLGEVYNEVHYELDLQSEHWKRYKGRSYGNIVASSASHEHKFKRRMKENRERWYREIAQTINQYAREQGWTGVHLAGPTELINLLKKYLNIEIIGETTRNYSGKSALDVIERTLLAN